MKRFSFLLVLGIFFAVGLFHWNELSATSQAVNSKITTHVIAALDNKGDDFSVSAFSAIDPTTMILLGSGLIGLAGIGRTKNKK